MVDPIDFYILVCVFLYTHFCCHDCLLSCVWGSYVFHFSLLQRDRYLHYSAHMQACIHTHTHASTHACMHTHTHTLVHTCARTHPHTHTDKRKHDVQHLYIYVNLSSPFFTSYLQQTQDSRFFLSFVFTAC